MGVVDAGRGVRETNPTLPTHPPRRPSASDAHRHATGPTPSGRQHIPSRIPSVGRPYKRTELSDAVSHTHTRRHLLPYFLLEDLLPLPNSPRRPAMSDYIPSSAQSQALLGPARRRPLYASLYVVVALPGGLLVRVSRRLLAVVWWALPRLPRAGRIRATPSRRIPAPLDPAQVEAVIAALRAAVARGARPIPALTQRRADSDSDSDWSGDEEEGGHPDDQHTWYPPIQSLEVGDARLFSFSGPTGSVPAELPVDSAPRLEDAPQGPGLCRHENRWILNAGTETFADPFELTNETTRTWVTRLKITTTLVGLSKQQLKEQNSELCEELQEQRFAEVAGQSLEQLLDVACSFCDARWSDVHISQQLTVFDALVDVIFNIQDLRFNRSGEVAGIIIKIVNAFKGVIQRSSNDIHISKESTIHPATFILIQGLDFFCRNRDMVQSILESGDSNTGPCSDMFNCLVSTLKEAADIFFKEKGQGYIFVLNNLYYVLQKDCHPGLLPPSLVSSLDSLIDQYIMRYLDEYWFPLMLSYLEGDSLKKPHRSSLEKFIEEFFSICDSQMTWKVQTVLKKVLRGEIVDLIIPKYVNFLKALQENPSSRCQSWLKGTRRARSEKPTYTGPQLKLVIRGLFER